MIIKNISISLFVDILDRLYKINISKQNNDIKYLDIIIENLTNY